MSRNLHNEYQIYSVDDIKNHYERMKGNNGHWFSKGTMEFFKCKLDGQVFGDESKNLFYFVSSERGPDSKRKYSIRSYNPITADIDTVGDFQQYSSLHYAKKAIERIIE